MAEFAVKGETHDGAVLTLRRGFPSREEAEDHPVTMRHWRRIWVEEIEDAPAPPTELPPLPWTVDFVHCYQGRNYFLYIKDANGRRIASLFGARGEREKMAEFVCAASRAAVDAS